MNSKRKIEINIVEVQTYKMLIQINSTVTNLFEDLKIKGYNKAIYSYNKNRTT